MIREIRLAEDVEAGDVRHQVVVHPEAAHGVVHGGVDHHRSLIGILTGDFLIHLEEVAVAGADGVLAEALGGIPEIEIDAEAGGGDAAAVVAGFLGST